MRDEWFGWRDPFSGEPYGDRTEWTEWDFALVAAFQTVEAYTDQNGIRQWQKEDPEALIDAERKIDKFQAAVARRTKGSSKKPYQPQDGEYWTPVVEADRPGNKTWTYEEWVADKTEKMVSESKVE